MKRLRMQPGPSEPVCHGDKSYPVSNVDWTCLAPDESGCILLPDDPDDHPEAIVCPYCKRSFLHEHDKEE